MSQRRARTVIAAADQLLYSLTNFLLAILVAHHSSPPGFGRYSILVATFLIVSTVNRGLTAEPVVIKFSTADKLSWLQAASQGLTTAILFGAVIGLGLLLISLVLLPGAFTAMAVAFSVSMPVLFAQDFLRYAAFAAGRPAAALANDVCVAIVQVGVSVAAIELATASAAAFVMAWGFAGLVGASVGMAILRVRPRAVSSRTLIPHSDLAGRLGADNFVAQLVQQSTGYLVAGVSGLAAAGGLRAAQTVFAPPAILSLGAQSALTPEFVRMQAASLASMRRAMRALTTGLVGFSSLFLAAALVCPNSLGVDLFGASWAQAKPLLLFIGLAMIPGSGVSIPAIVALRALGDARRTLRARTLANLLTLVAVATGAFVGEAKGACIGLTIASTAQAVIWRVQVAASFRERRAQISSGRPAASIPLGPAAPAPAAPTVVATSAGLGEVQVPVGRHRSSARPRPTKPPGGTGH